MRIRDEAKRIRGRCHEDVLVRGINFPRYNQCKRRGVIREEGQLWCKQHAPSAKRAREAKSIKEHSEKFDARMQEYAKARAFDQVVDIAERAIMSIDPSARSRDRLNKELATIRKRVRRGD